MAETRAFGPLRSPSFKLRSFLARFTRTLNDRDLKKLETLLAELDEPKSDEAPALPIDSLPKEPNATRPTSDEHEEDANEKFPPAATGKATHGQPFGSKAKR